MCDIHPNQVTYPQTSLGKQRKRHYKKWHFSLILDIVFNHMLFDIICNILHNFRIQEHENIYFIFVLYFITEVHR